MRRAAVSVSSNIAEGAGRESKKDFSRFVIIALGSLNEVESQLHVSRGLKYIKDSDFCAVLEKIKELGNLLGGLRKYLKY